VGRWTLLTACRTQCDRQKGSHDCSRSRLGNFLRGARRQMRLETAAPSSVNGRLLTVFQIQYTRQIETDTVQFGGSCILSDTVQSSGFQPCASLAAYNSFASFLAKKTTPHTSYSTLCPFCSTFVGDGMVLSPPRYPLPCGPSRRSRRHVGRELDQNITFSERIDFGALKVPGNGNVGRKVYKHLLPTFFAPPSSQRPEVPLPPHGALSICWPTFCVRCFLYIP